MFAFNHKPFTIERGNSDRTRFPAEQCIHTVRLTEQKPIQRHCIKERCTELKLHSVNVGKDA